jgi:hypothetical protein
LLTVSDGAKTTKIDGRTVEARLAPGCVGKLVIQWKRHANQPSLRCPWDL